MKKKKFLEFTIAYDFEIYRKVKFNISLIKRYSLQSFTIKEWKSLFAKKNNPNDDFLLKHSVANTLAFELASKNVESLDELEIDFIEIADNDSVNYLYTITDDSREVYYTSLWSLLEAYLKKQWLKITN